MAMMRSSGVRNHAFAGESGKKNQKSTDTIRVIRPKIIMSLHKSEWGYAGNAGQDTHHCHAMNVVDFMCRTPKAMRPRRIIAAPFIRTVKKSKCRAKGMKSRRTPVSYSLRLFFARVEHRGDQKESWGDCALANAKEDPACEQCTKVFCSCMAEQSYCPDEDVQANHAVRTSLHCIVQCGNTPHPLAHREVLQRKVLRPLKNKEEEVEYRREPVELVLVDVSTIARGCVRQP
jgi:hypothetical protein